MECVCTNRSKESGWVIDPSKDRWLRQRQITCWRAFTAATPGPGQTLSSQCSRFDPLFPHCKASFTTIRISIKVISGPFWPAEPNRNIHLPIALLVVARVARTSPKSEGKKFRPKFLHHLVKHQQPTIRMAWRVGFRLIRCAESTCSLCLSIGPLVLVLQAKTKNCDTKISPKLGWIFTPLYNITNLQSELRGGSVLDLFNVLNLTVTSICR
jgi:hypothetical protein